MIGTQQQIQELKKILSHNVLKIGIIAHQNPDADAFGSILSLCYYLRKKGHQVQPISPTIYPVFLEWMNSKKEVLIHESEQKEEVETFLQQADILFCLDFSSYNRLKGLDKAFRESKATKIVIDHHLDSNIEADYSLIHTEAAATAELIYTFIEAMGDVDLIDVPIGEFIYAGIVTDTGSFKYPATTPRVHTIAADLIRLGVNHHKIHQVIYDNNTESRLRFLGYLLSHKLTVLAQFRTAYILVSDDELRRFGYQTGDTEGVVNYALSIKNIVMAIMLIERPEGIKISFRSRGDFAVNDFARNYFSGGGHQNAAGGISHESLKNTEQKILKLLPQYEKQLKETIL
ncbi:MAG: bifunctional oligoribonuclease/PAP phosphatase NrnA [Cytophagales bacterium]|nr:MAG: bifunctional oligoribonuclease/PAP phosphatase NrnA [Cytophagales bacterium]